jgi:fibrillarin-like pre-rRNA processing protein
MKPTKNTGIYVKGSKLFTINPEHCKGIKIYGEQLRSYDGKEFRSWNPYRSKLAALLNKKKNLLLPLNESTSILYLGAATGTTVSHLSDICINGIIYAVEPSPIAAKTLLESIEHRINIIPIIEDANHPDRYDHLLTSPVDLIYMDISQRNQAEIFITNAKRYLKENGQGILMVKARSIDIALKPKQAYDMVKKELENNELEVRDVIDLSPFEKDHAALLISSKMRS